MGRIDPTRTRLSPHFLLSDLMGCNSVYSKGYPNVFDKRAGVDKRLDNGRALCQSALEPILALSGSFSISYGFISPDLSRQIVTYQDPDKPAHHRWDLGAAADICVHHHVLQSTSNFATPESGAPIIYAFDHLTQLPLSRLIAYSESPYLCIAVSAEEISANQVRGAWYENRFTGQPKVKPEYLKYPTAETRRRGYLRLQENGLPHGWLGAGYPTYHGGGRKQLHHIRVSDYTMASDWLYDQEFVTEGKRNIPALTNSSVREAFDLAGATYDWMLRITGLPRLSIVSGYTSHLTPGWIEGRDWREGDVSFEIVPPEYITPEQFTVMCFKADKERMHMLFGHITMAADDDRVIVTVRRDIEW